MDLYEKSLGLLALLQFNKMVAAAQRTKLAQPSLRPAFAAPRDFPTIVNRDTIAFGPAAVNPRAVFAYVIIGPTAHQLLEFPFRNPAGPGFARMARAHCYSLSYGL